MRITEVKRHLDGRTERFDCHLVLRRPHLVVVRFEHIDDGHYMPAEPLVQKRLGCPPPRKTLYLKFREG